MLISHEGLFVKEINMLPFFQKQVRVADVGDDSGVNYCSDQFTLMASEEAPEAEEPDGPYLHVTWPTAEDVLEAGDEYTIEVMFVTSR